MKKIFKSEIEGNGANHTVGFQEFGALFTENPL